MLRSVRSSLASLPSSTSLLTCLFSNRSRTAASVALALLLTAAVSRPAFSQIAPIGGWVSATPAIHPSARDLHAAAYDAATGTMVLFGGQDQSGAALADTWTWDGTAWTQATPATSPSARYGASMAYDAATGTVVLFGGFSAGSSYQGDTWSWNGTTWTQLSTASSPAARAFSTMAYDPATSSIVLFGGANGGPLGDTWTFDGTTWTARNPALTPPARSSAVSAYFPSAGTVLLYGGNGANGPLQDDWTWNGTNWKLLTQYAVPGPILGGAMDYNASLGTLQLFGGDAGGGPLNTMWSWNGVNWTQQQFTVTPPARESTSLVYDAVTRDMVLFGGTSGAATLSDSWDLTPSSINVGAVGIGGSILQTPVFFTLSADANLSTLAVLTGGNPNIDFQLGTGSTCSGALTAGSTCVVNVNFTPRYAGQRLGAVELVSGGSVVATTLLQGTGNGSQVTFSPGTISTYAGNGTAGYVASQDGGPAIAAELNGPFGAAIDGAGNIYIADELNQLIRKITASTGIITTVAGNGTAGYNPAQDGGPATAASLNNPTGVAVDGAGNLFIADSANNRVREVSASTGIITTVAGNGVAGYFAFQDGGPANQAELQLPYGVAVDGQGNLYIADYGNQRIREVSANGIINTIAGNGIGNYVDNVPATSGEVNSPFGVTVDPQGNVFIADTGNQRIRKVSAATGIISTIAGNGIQGFVQSQEGGPATSADINSPYSIVIDAAGDIFFSDTSNQRIRKVEAATGNISTVAGFGSQGYIPAQEGGAATGARLNYPRGLVMDGSGNLYFADALSFRIRKVSGKAGIAFPTVTTPGTIDGADGDQLLTLSNIGNLPLGISSISTSDANFTLGIPSGGCVIESVPAGGSCQLGATFTPQVGGGQGPSGIYVSTLNITDDAPAATAVPQPILSGSSIAGALNVIIPDMTVAQGTPSLRLTVILSYAGTSIPTGSLSLTVNGSTAGVGTPACVFKGAHQNCQFPYSLNGLPTGSYVISATKAGDTNYITSTQTATLTVQ